MNFKIIAQDSKYVYLVPEKDESIKGHYPDFYPFAIRINKKTKKIKNMDIKEFCNAVEKNK